MLTTTSSEDEALRLAEAVVTAGLAACANVVPAVTSVYRWKGELQRSAETLLVIKTTDTALASLERRLVELHSYDVPEVVALPVETGYEPYLAWVREGSGGLP